MKVLTYVAIFIAILSLFISIKSIDKTTQLAKGQTMLAESLGEIFEEHGWSYHLEWRGQ